jgi:drug/metabolite transporter (DMT)-like permease
MECRRCAMKKYLPYLAGVGMALIFGFSFLFSKNALDSLDVFELLFLRFLTAAITMTLLMLIGLIKVDLKGKNIKPLLVVATLQPGIYFIMETFGLTYTSSSQAGIMMAFIPVIVTILAAIILDEKPKKIQIGFIILSVSGVILTVVGGGSSSGGGQLKGIIFLLGAVLSAGFFNIASRKASRNFTPYEITYIMMCLGAVVFGFIFLVQGIIKGDLNVFAKLTMKPITSILYLGVLSSVVAFLMSNYSISRLPSSQASIFANLTTVVSIIAGVTIRKEAFETYKLIAAIMIIAGVWGTNYFGQLGKSKEIQLADKA